MAWAQRDDADYPSVSTNPDRLQDEIPTSGEALRCDGCARVIRAAAFLFAQGRYCSSECVKDAQKAARLPGLYLG